MREREREGGRGRRSRKRSVIGKIPYSSTFAPMGKLKWNRIDGLILKKNYQFNLQTRFIFPI